MIYSVNFATQYKTGYVPLKIVNNFTINGIKADYRDFGEQYVKWEEIGFEVSIFFEPFPAAISVLDKYKINEEEYIRISEVLKFGLSYSYTVDDFRNEMLESWLRDLYTYGSYKRGKS